MKSKHLIYIYFTLLILELMGEVVFDLKGVPYGIWSFKPLLMPVLMYWYYKETKASTGLDKIILVSLFFSWWGDTFLMPDVFPEGINFLLGLASFLIAHVLYIVAFVKTKTENKSILKRKPYLILPLAIFLYTFLSYLFKVDKPGFAELGIPVIVYATIIMLMVIAAIGRYGKVPPSSFKWVLIGALSFMVSDVVLALGRFTYLFDDYYFVARLMNMPLYVLGQYWIAKGCVLMYKEETA